MDCYITTLSKYGCFKMKQANITKKTYILKTYLRILHLHLLNPKSTPPPPFRGGSNFMNLYSKTV